MACYMDSFTLPYWIINWKYVDGIIRSKKTEINGRGDSLRWPRDTLYPLALTSPTSGGRSVGIVRWGTKAPEFFM
jgi:hypothetical protein